MADRLEPLPTVARLYYTGHGARRYKRASVLSGPGEALCFTSLANERLRQLEAMLLAQLAAEVAKARAESANLRTVAQQVLRDMQAQGVLLEWQTVLEDAIRTTDKGDNHG